MPTWRGEGLMNRVIKLTSRERKILLAYADNNMNAAKTADALFFHKNTVLYQLDNIHKKYKMDPRCFYDLCKLVCCAQVENKREEGTS